MTTATIEKTQVPAGLDGRVLARILEEGWGPGAWHGADLAAALADVPAELAFWRPAPGRHNLAEIALHHAWCARSVRAQLSGEAPAPFVLPGDDWFELPAEGRMSWPEIHAAAAAEIERLRETVAAIAAGRLKSPLPEAERFDLVLGITCHAVYHAGQVQLLRRLYAG
jgi:hypothetical protein